MDDLKEIIKLTTERASLINYGDQEAVEELMKEVLNNQAMIVENLAIVLEYSLNNSDSILKHMEMHVDGEV